MMVLQDRVSLAIILYRRVFYICMRPYCCPLRAPHFFVML